LALTAALVTVAPLSADEDLRAALAACRAEPDETRRLACYDRQVDRQAANTSAGVAAAATTDVAAATGATANESAGAAAATAATPKGAVEPTAAASAPSATPAQGTAAGATTAAAATAEDKFGYSGGMSREEKDQKKTEEKALDEISATVAEVVTRQRGELVVTLDNGQVWAQKAADGNFRVKAGDAVKIKAGFLGSYVMSVGTSDRSTRVTRVR
jgi:hypothetical protein